MWHKLPLPEYINDPLRMEQVCREIRDTKLCGLDTETTGLNLMKDHVLFWSLCPSLDVRYCLSRDMLEILSKELGNDESITWVMSNANFDNCMLANSGVPLLRGDIHCTQVMDWLHDENRFGRHGLKDIAMDHIRLNMRSFKSVFEKQRGETYQDTLIRMMENDPKNAIDYASLDALASLATYKYLKKELENEYLFNGINLWNYYRNLEAPYSKVLYHNIRRGLMIDVGWLKEIGKPINDELNAIQRKINKAAGFEINPRSPKQLIDLFINRLGKEPIAHTSGGASGDRKPSVDEKVLKIWAKDTKVAADILEYRSLEKIRGTYIDGMVKRLSPDGRIHTMINQHIAVTGRITSSDPNLHNIPRPGSDIWALRGAFMPDDGYVLMAADYEQLEMRILAHLANDEKMKQVIWNGWDIHTGTASIMYEKPYDEIVEAKFLSGWLKNDGVPKKDWPAWISLYLAHRQDSKSIGFGIVYGEGDAALARKLGCSKEEATAKKEKFFSQFPGIQRFIELTHLECRSNLEVHTVLGRKRRLPDADSKWWPAYYDYRKRVKVPERPGEFAARALRQDVNSRIQGSAAEIAKLSQIKCEADERLRSLGVRQLLQIHDEILFEVPKEAVKEASVIVKEIMSKPYDDVPERFGLDFRELSIPLGVDIGVGEAWSEAH
jgi:DNA polymerase-1